MRAEVSPAPAPKFRDAAEARQHGEMREAVSSARWLRHAGVVVAGIGAYGILYWWRPLRHSSPNTLLGSALRITFKSGAVYLIPWEAVLAVHAIPVGITMAVIGARHIEQRTKAFLRTFPRDLSDLTPPPVYDDD